MTEKETLSKLIAKYEKNLTDNTASLYKMQGEIEGLEKAGDQPAVHPVLFLKLYARVNVRDERTIAFLKALNSWIQRTEETASESRDLLIKLLGLSPKATKQEIIDAIDDVGPVFASYRNKKRGT
jgi:hypothetical protein